MKAKVFHGGVVIVDDNDKPVSPEESNRLTTPKDDWPRHPNGRRMSIGEMDKEDSKRIIKASFARLKKELESPEFREAFKNADKVLK